MPRNLARLRFRALKQPRSLNLSRIHPEDHAALHNRLRAHALELSKPHTPLSLQIVVHPKWKQQPGKQSQHVVFRPHTLRDLVDPERMAKHGDIIYVFANIRTGQIIYSLVEMLDQYHLDQLPFLGKHSKPPTIRPDEWTPHCVITFPHSAQGHQAFRKLREFRRLHEVSWDKTNPEWIRLPAQQRMKKIMNQVANTSADLAEVLNIQKKQAVDMRKKIVDQDKKEIRLISTKWAEVEAVINSEREADNPQWLEHQIKNLERQLGTKRTRDEADVQRIKNAKKSHEVHLRRVQRARARAEDLKQLKESGELELLKEQIAILDKMSPLKKEAKALKQDLAKASNELAMAERKLERAQQKQEPTEGIVSDKNRLAGQKAEVEQKLANTQTALAGLQETFETGVNFEARESSVIRSIIPPELRKPLPQPFDMDVQIKWADLRNAEYAAGAWPEAIVHDSLNLRAARQGVQLMDPEQYQITVRGEVQDMVKSIERQALEAQALAEPEPEPEPEKTGVWKYLPEVKNPFKRAEA